MKKDSTLAKLSQILLCECEMGDMRTYLCDFFVIMVDRLRSQFVVSKASCDLLSRTSYEVFVAQTSPFDTLGCLAQVCDVKTSMRRSSMSAASRDAKESSCLLCPSKPIHLRSLTIQECLRRAEEPGLREWISQCR